VPKNCKFYVHFYVFNFLVLFYFITFTPKCFALAVVAVSAEPSNIYCCTKSAKCYNCCTSLLLLRMLADSAQNSDICSLHHRWELEWKLGTIMWWNQTGKGEIPSMIYWQHPQLVSVSRRRKKGTCSPWAVKSSWRHNYISTFSGDL